MQYSVPPVYRPRELVLPRPQYGTSYRASRQAACRGLSVAAGSCCSTPSSLQVRRCLGLGLWLPGPYVRTGWMSVVDILVQKPSRPHLLPVLPVLRELRLGAWGRRAGTPAGVVALAQELVLLPGRWLVVGGAQYVQGPSPLRHTAFRSFSSLTRSILEAGTRASHFPTAREEHCVCIAFLWDDGPPLRDRGSLRRTNSKGSSPSSKKRVSCTARAVPNPALGSPAIAFARDPPFPVCAEPLPHDAYLSLSPSPLLSPLTV